MNQGECFSDCKAWLLCFIINMPSSQVLLIFTEKWTVWEAHYKITSSQQLKPPSQSSTVALYWNMPNLSASLRIWECQLFMQCIKLMTMFCNVSLPLLQRCFFKLRVVYMKLLQSKIHTIKEARICLWSFFINT